MPAEIIDLVKYRLDTASEDLTVSGTPLCYDSWRGDKKEVS